MTSSLTARHAVQLGAALLDKGIGTVWAENLDLDILDLSDPYKCVLGQTFGSFSKGLDHLFPQNGYLDVITSHGFDVSVFAALADRPAAYADLTEAWREEVIARRNSTNREFCTR